MIGRRNADRVWTRRVGVMAAAGVLAAVAAGFGVRHLLRAEAFAVSSAPPAAAETTGGPVAAGVAPPAPVDAPSASTAPLDARRDVERGRRQLDAGEARSAVGTLGEAARVLPDDPEVAHLYGRALLAFGSRDRAVFQMQRAVRLAPQHPGYREDLARALQASGRGPQAARVLQEGGLMVVEPAMPSAEATSAVPTGRFKGKRSFTNDDLAAAGGGGGH